MKLHSVKSMATALLVAVLLAGAVQAQDSGARPASPPKASSSTGQTTARIKKLVEQLGDDSFSIREKAQEELLALGRPAVAALKQACKSDDAEVRHRAETILTAIETSLQYLLENIKDRDSRVRREAIEALERLETKAKPAIPALTAALNDKEEAVREAAVSALLAIDPENKAVANTVPAKARVGDKYSKLLRRLKVPQDKQSYTEFKDYGHYQATDYAGYTNLPAGYWVYVYPHWYIWGNMKQGK